MKQVILIIDDVEEIRMSLSKIVEQLDVTPMTASNGLEALTCYNLKRLILSLQI